MTSHTTFSRTAATVLASCVVCLTASFAHAASAEGDVTSLAVSYSDLNLATEQGSRALHQRIVSAAQQVCPTNVGPNARLLRASRQCVADAVERAMNDVKAPQLAAVRAAQAR